jgi:hypothetical protein
MAPPTHAYDLIDLLRVAELVCFDKVGRSESVMKSNSHGGMEHFERTHATGARIVYEVGTRPVRSAVVLLPAAAGGLPASP